MHTLVAEIGKQVRQPLKLNEIYKTQGTTINDLGRGPEEIEKRRKGFPGKNKFISKGGVQDPKVAHPRTKIGEEPPPPSGLLVVP